MASTEVNNALRRLVDKRREADVAAKKEKAAKKAARDQELLVIELLEESGETSTTIDLGDGYGRIQFVPNSTKFSKVFDEDEFRQWAIREGREEEFFTKGVRKAPLNQVVRDAIDEDGELPPGVDFSEKQYVTVTHR